MKGQIYKMSHWFAGRLYSLQKAMEMRQKSADCRQFMVTMMDYLEQVGKKYHTLLSFHFFNG